VKGTHGLRAEIAGHIVPEKKGNYSNILPKPFPQFFGIFIIFCASRNSISQLTVTRSAKVTVNFFTRYNIAHSFYHFQPQEIYHGAQEIKFQTKQARCRPCKNLHIK
jgi:hypothetical protein